MNAFANEREEIEKILQCGFRNNGRNKKDLILLAKYFIWELEYTKYKTAFELLNFCIKWDKKYNKVRDRKMLRDAINAANKAPIKENKIINITINEIKNLEKIKNFKYQKIAFAMLVMSKFGHNNPDSDYYCLSREKYMDKRIISFLDKKITKKQYEDCLTHLSNLEMIELPYRGVGHDNYIIIKYADNKSDNAIEINNYTDKLIVQYYLDYYGGEMIVCKKCEKLVLKETQKQYLCKECFKERTKEIKRNWWNKKH